MNLTQILNNSKVKHVNNKKRHRGNILAIQEKQTRDIMADLHAVYEYHSCAKGNVYKFDGKGREVSLSKTLQQCLARVEMKWRIGCYLIIEESNGKRKLDPFEIVTNTPCKFSDINGYVVDRLSEFCREYKYQDLIKSVGWIATSEANEIPDLWLQAS